MITLIITVKTIYETNEQVLTWLNPDFISRLRYTVKHVYTVNH